MDGGTDSITAGAYFFLRPKRTEKIWTEATTFLICIGEVYNSLSASTRDCLVSCLDLSQSVLSNVRLNFLK